jgi:hypothetical protein
MGLRRYLLPVTLLFATLFLLSSITAPRQATVPERGAPEVAPAPAPHGGGETRTATMPEDGTVELQVGDLLELTVTSEELGTVEFAALGKVEAVGPDAPAHFSFYADRPGRSEVRMLGTGEILGEVVVLAPGDRPRAAPSVEA